MTRRILATLATLAAVLASLTAADTTGSRAAATDPPGGPGTAGPPYDFTTELVGQFGPVVPLKNQAMITRTKHGYRFQAGQQDTRLVVELTGARLTFADRGTRKFKRLAPACQRKRTNVGVAAVCRVPDTASPGRPLLVEVWPRLGNDHVDGSRLSDHFAMAVLGDAGRDTALLGAGPDFFNGFTGRDRVRGGDSNDWIRSGKHDDRVDGGAGHDQIVDTAGADFLIGGEGNDRLGAGPGNDRVDARGGVDYVLCSSGTDTVWTEQSDRLTDCERVYD